jgi:hypothetical protein
VASAAVAMAIGAALTAQHRETITAVAEMTSAGAATQSAPFTLVIDRFATASEQEALVGAVKKDGTEAARQFLMKRDDAGTLQLGDRKAAIKYAFERAAGDGRLITVITSEPIAWAAPLPADGKPSASYPLGFVLIELAASGEGHGELVPAARVRVDEHGAIVTEASRPTDVVRLARVVKK